MISNTISPHKVWLNAIGDTVKSLTKGKLTESQLVEYYKKPPIEGFKYLSEVLMKISESVNIGPQVLEKIITECDVGYTLFNAVEFCVNSKVVLDAFDTYSEYQDGTKQFDVENFKVPYDELVITFLADHGTYLSKFVSIFKLTEKYKYKDKLCNVFNIKLGGFTKKLPGSHLIVDEDTSVATYNEFMFIPELYPRIFIRCPKASNCEHFMNFSIAKNLFIGENPVSEPNITDKISDICLKTLRTCDLCQYNLCNSVVTTQNTVALQNYELLFFVLFILNKYNTRKVVNKVGDLTIRKRLSIPNTAPFKISDTAVYFSDTIFKYNKEYIPKGGTHASPREHSRQGHTRHYKNGKVVQVRDTTVNKGKSKMKYLIKD